MKRKREPIVIKYEEPENWKEVYNKISEMRKEKEAPVDTMGCASFKKDCEPKDGRVNTLWSLMLSSQTKDAMTAAAMKNLVESGSTVPDILAYSDADLDEKISKVGFHNKKVGYLKATARILHDKYDDDIPDTIEGMLALPGVGPKMAYLLMTHAWNKTMGIGVDVHVHRISNRLGWVHTNTPEETRLSLEGWLPKEYWGQDGVNRLLVGFGQTVCLPVGPKCGQCKVNDLCPSAFKKNEEKKVKKEIKTEIKTEVKTEKNKKLVQSKLIKNESHEVKLETRTSPKRMKKESVEIKKEEMLNKETRTPKNNNKKESLALKRETGGNQVSSHASPQRIKKETIDSPQRESIKKEKAVVERVSRATESPIINSRTRASPRRESTRKEKLELELNKRSVKSKYFKDESDDEEEDNEDGDFGIDSFEEIKVKSKRIKKVVT
jgi:endonuclease-3